MSEEFYRESENQELEKSILEARKHAQGKSSEFLFRIEQVESGGNEKIHGRIERYEITARPDPKAPKENHPYIHCTVDRYTESGQYIYVAAQLIHTINRYWQNKNDISIVAELDEKQTKLLMLFKEHRHILLEDFLGMYTRLELESYSAILPDGRMPRILQDDEDLRVLSERGLVDKHPFGSTSNAFITGDGMRIALLIEETKESRHPEG